MEVKYNKNVLFHVEQGECIFNICNKIENQLGILKEEIYLEQNGKILGSNQSLTKIGDIQIILKLRGGKGGFGSMLRAIGAQIEKTTNREACRDLSGRRLRDINEEQRLKNWIASQAEREKETAERKKKKLEKLCQVPKHEFHDENYDKERSDLPDRVEDALLQGLQASASTKRTADNDKKVVKKRKLWVDEDFDNMSSSDETDSDDVENFETSSITKTTNTVKAIKN